jgi:hypothetical protein
LRLLASAVPMALGHAWGRRERGLQLLLLPVPAMTGLKPSGVGRLAIEVESAVPTHAAVVGAGAREGWLRGPGERALLGGKERKLQDDFVDGKKALRGSGRTGGTLMIRSCMVMGHGTE